MALQRAAGDLRAHAVCSWKGSLSAGPLDFFYCGAEWPKSAWGLSLGSVSGGGRERLQISTVFCLSLSSVCAHCCQCDFLSLSLKVQPGPPKHHWLHFWRSFAPSNDNLDSSGFQRFLNRVYTNIYIYIVGQTVTWKIYIVVQLVCTLCLHASKKITFNLVEAKTAKCNSHSGLLIYNVLIIHV